MPDTRLADKRVRWHTARTLGALLLGLLVFAAPAHALKRVALVVGVADYSDAPLKNPTNDARAMAARLESLGFEVNVALATSDFLPSLFFSVLTITFAASFRLRLLSLLSGSGRRLALTFALIL